MDFLETLPKYVGIIEKDKYKFWVSSDQGGHGENLIFLPFLVVVYTENFVLFDPVQTDTEQSLKNMAC